MSYLRHDGRPLPDAEDGRSDPVRLRGAAESPGCGAGRAGGRSRRDPGQEGGRRAGKRHPAHPRRGAAGRRPDCAALPGRAALLAAAGRAARGVSADARRPDGPPQVGQPRRGAERQERRGRARADLQARRADRGGADAGPAGLPEPEAEHRPRVAHRRRGRRAAARRGTSTPAPSEELHGIWRRLEDAIYTGRGRETTDAGEALARLVARIEKDLR